MGSIDTNNKHRDVFISYSSYNKLQADVIVNELEQYGITCWYTPRNVSPGETWVSAITEAIHAAKIVVLVYTHESNASQHVLNEINLANASNKTIVPFRLCDEPLNDQLAYYLARTQWVDAPSASLYDDVAHLRNRLLDQLSQGEGREGNTSPYAHSGLWWTALEPGGLFAFFPKQTWYWQTILLATMAVILLLLPASHLTYLSVPFLLIGCNLTIASLTGKGGLKLTMPLVAYALSAIAWMVSYTGVGFRTSTTITIMILGALLLLIVICSNRLATAKRDGQGAMLCMSGFVSLCAFACAYAFRKGYITKVPAQILAGIWYTMPIVQGVTSYIEQQQAAVLKVPKDIRQRQMLERLTMLGLGLVPMVLSSLFDTAGALIVLLVALITYVVLGIVTFAFVKRSTTEIGTFFLPYSIAGTISLLAQAKPRYLPLSAYIKMVITFCHDSVVGKAACTFGTALTEAFSWLLDKLIASACAFITGSDAASMPALLIDVLCFLSSIVILTSVVGVGISRYLRMRASRENATGRGEGE